MSNMAYETCKFRDCSTQLGSAQPDTTGLCRAGRPKLNIMTGGALWPFTEDTDWCGEFQDISAPPDKGE